MLDRFERVLKIVCLGMGALLLWQVGVTVWRGDPLARLTIPDLPELPGATNSTAAPAHKDTNAATAQVAATGTNSTNHTKATNVVSSTNAVGATNSTNAAGLAKTAAVAKVAPQQVNPSGESGPLPPGMTPEMMASLSPEVLAQLARGGPPGSPGGAGMNKLELPHDVQNRLDKIVNSELFGPVIHPTPMALMGISDDEAFLRATNGQSGPVKVGGEMGGIKLLRIGVNRVLVETAGQKKELTLFGGLDGESLMPKSSETNSATAAAKPDSDQKSATNQPAPVHPPASKAKETQ